MRRPTLIASLVTLAALTLTTAVFAGGSGPRAGMGPRLGSGPDAFLGRLGDHLDLSDEQRAQIEAIMDAERDRLDQLRDQLAAERTSFRAERDPGHFDEAAVRAHGERAGALHTEILVVASRARAAAHNVLTAEQKAELASLRDLLEPDDNARGGRPRGRHGRR